MAKENAAGKATCGITLPKGKSVNCDSAITDARVRLKSGEKVLEVKDNNKGLAKKSASGNPDGNPKKRQS